ncbi:MAG: hypothetical protein NTW21_44065 [Verrucomicrobia bacterium]|nr:hypothetical protein [Verrucomicrobiota bacterium]
MPANNKSSQQAPPTPEREAGAAGYDDLVQAITGLAASLQALEPQAVELYTPIIESIVRSRSRDTHHIEHTLDGLLGFCGHDPALVLYKKLCRHYWNIDPPATASYINAYRDMWDSEQTAENESPPDAPQGGPP